MRSAFSILFLFFVSQLHAQLTVSGTIYDSSRANYIENVRVISTRGLFALTDSMGKYTITVTEGDSLFFHYNNKPTRKFAVREIADPAHFDISLRINVKSRYSVLKEVTVFSRSYREDSLENRQTYADIYSYTKPGLRSDVSSTGVAGADLDELINVFRFRRNKNLRAFQRRLETQEQEKYINYRFNKTSVHRITQLAGNRLDSFLIWYRPSYEFARSSDEVVFNQYVLQAFYQFRKIMQSAKKPEDHN